MSRRTAEKTFEVIITREGREALNSLDKKTKNEPGQLQIVGIKRDNKFLCGVDGCSLDVHASQERSKTWMCPSCGQVYVNKCLEELLSAGIKRPCTGSGCAAAKRMTPLSKATLRKLGNW
jgi:predicted RNA-binding Zn-ribbon protein involved in translation (DUF1610 family)